MEFNMIKKIMIVFLMFALFGCQNDNINKQSLEQIVKTSIKTDAKLFNTNSKGYKYYLPNEFTLYKEDGFVSELLSRNKK